MKRINKKELDKLASDYSLEYHNKHSSIKIELADGILFKDNVAEAFKAGYLFATKRQQVKAAPFKSGILTGTSPKKK